MESMPFLHSNQVFTIIFTEDLAFSEVRAILDYLLERNAFDAQVQETEGRYLIDVHEAFFEVWVYDTDVIIQRE